MKTRTILLGGALALGVVGAAAAAVTSCPVPTHKPIHHVASYHARPRVVTRRVNVLASAATPTYAEAPPPERVVHERVYEAAYPGPAYYPEPYPAYYPGYAYGGPVVYGYGGPYWGGRWGYGYRGGWHGGWRGGGHWHR